MSSFFSTSVRYLDLGLAAAAVARVSLLTFTIDFTYVISYGYEQCYRTQDATTYHRLMREVWIPYVLAEPCLLSAIFHVACRNYLVVAKHQDHSNRFEIKMLEYRAKCLNNASKAIESKAAASDTIIALALLMASESVSGTKPLSTFYN